MPGTVEASMPEHREFGERAPDEAPSLPGEAREHLGRVLRSSLEAEAERPAYLGDPVTPPEFEDQVGRLRSRLAAHEKGPAAVASALDDLLKG
jgi:hypothetical protein